MDLTIAGLNKRPKIEAIEFALKQQDGKVREDIGLGTNGLTEEDKEYLKKLVILRHHLTLLSKDENESY